MVIVTRPPTTLDLDTCVPQAAIMLPSTSTRRGVLNSGRSLPFELRRATLPSLVDDLRQGIIRWCSMVEQHVLCTY